MGINVVDCIFVCLVDLHLRMQAASSEKAPLLAQVRDILWNVCVRKAVFRSKPQTRQKAHRDGVKLMSGEERKRIFHRRSRVRFASFYPAVDYSIH